MKFKVNKETLMSNKLDNILTSHVIDKTFLETFLLLCQVEETDIFEVLKSKAIYYVEVFEGEFLTEPCFLVCDEEGNLQIWSDEYLPLEDDIYFTNENECDAEVRIKNAFYQRYTNKIREQLLKIDGQEILNIADLLDLIY